MEYLIYTYYVHQPWTKSTLRGEGTDGHTYYGESIDKYPFDAMCRPSSQGRLTYITKECWDTLSDAHKAIARTRVQGILTKVGYPTKDTIVECFRSPCRAFLPDACEGVSCPDMCVGADKYDQVCQDGICVRGTLIETNSIHCGYTPEPTPDDPMPTPSDPTVMYIAVGGALIIAYYILSR